MFLKNKNIFFIIRRSKVTDYAALKLAQFLFGYNLLLVMILNAGHQNNFGTANMDYKFKNFTPTLQESNSSH